MNWNKYKKEFEWDGSWRDLYILNTDISHWQKLIDLLQGGAYRIEFKVDNDTAAIPRDVKDIFHKRNEAPVLMSIEEDGIVINCHFFTEQEIEFDIDPREIMSEERLNKVFEFMQRIGGLLQKEVIMTPESFQKEVIFRYVPETDRIEYVPARR